LPPLHVTVLPSNSFFYVAATTENPDPVIVAEVPTGPVVGVLVIDNWGLNAAVTVKVVSAVFEPSLAEMEYGPAGSGATVNVQLNAPVASAFTELPVGEVPTVQPVNTTENGATGVSVTVVRGRKSVPDATTAAPTGPVGGDN